MHLFNPPFIVSDSRSTHLPSPQIPSPQTSHSESPNYFTAEETRIVLLNKLLLSSSSPATAQLHEILEQGVHGPDYTLNDVSSDDLALLDYSTAAIDGNFREVSRSLHSKTRVQSKSGFRAGSAKDMSTALSSLAPSLSNLGDISVRRTGLPLSDSISDVELGTQLPR